MVKFYDKTIEDLMRLHYTRLSEKDRRQYAAIEVLKLPYGGQTYLSNLLNISRSTIRKGVSELLDNTSYDEIPKAKQRRTGGGRHFFLSKS